jgi:hypothetical protein
MLENPAFISATGAGNLDITGTSLRGTRYAKGVFLTGGPCVTTNNGTLRITGTSYATGTLSYGMHADGGSNISSTGGGNIILTGNAPLNDGTGRGVDIVDNDVVVYSNAGQISITTNSLNLTSPLSATSAGSVLIQTLGAGVNLGGDDSSANMGLSQSELDRITANVLTIGNSTQGNIFVTSAVSVPANVSLALLACTTSNSITVGAALSATGSGAISLTGRNIEVSGNISTTAGDITLQANNGTQQSGDFIGVYISGANLSTSGGNITANGRGGNNKATGMCIVGGANLYAGGNGTVTLLGQGGNSTNGQSSYGIYIDNSSTLISTNNGGPSF